MGAVVGIVAGLIALLGLLVALGNAGYLAMLNSAARKRGLSGESAALFVKERRGVAIGTTAVAALGLLLTLGGSVPVDVLGAVLAAGGGVAAKRALGRHPRPVPRRRLTPPRTSGFWRSHTGPRARARFVTWV